MAGETRLGRTTGEVESHSKHGWRGGHVTGCRRMTRTSAPGVVAPKPRPQVGIGGRIALTQRGRNRGVGVSDQGRAYRRLQRDGAPSKLGRDCPAVAEGDLAPAQPGESLVDGVHHRELRLAVEVAPVAACSKSARSSRVHDPSGATSMSRTRNSVSHPRTLGRIGRWNLMCHPADVSCLQDRSPRTSRWPGRRGEPDHPTRGRRPGPIRKVTAASTRRAPGRS